MSFDPTAGNIVLNISDADKENIIEGYNGPDLPARFIVQGELSRVYIDTTDNGDPMLKVLYKSTHKDYNGFPVWDNITLTPAAAFKWAPFCELVNIKTKELNTGIKVDTTKQTAAGYPVTHIGTWNIEEQLVDVQFSVTYRKNEETGNRWPELQFIDRG